MLLPYGGYSIMLLPYGGYSIMLLPYGVYIALCCYHMGDTKLYCYSMVDNSNMLLPYGGYSIMLLPHLWYGIRMFLYVCVMPLCWVIGYSWSVQSSLHVHISGCVFGRDTYSISPYPACVSSRVTLHLALMACRKLLQREVEHTPRCICINNTPCIVSYSINYTSVLCIYRHLVFPTLQRTIRSSSSGSGDY